MINEKSEHIIGVVSWANGERQAFTDCEGTG